MIDFDVLLQTLGTMGTYQVVAFAFMCYFGIPSGLNAVAPVFIEFTPSYSCKTNDTVGEADVSTPMRAALNTTTRIADESEQDGSCMRYKYNSTKCNDGDMICLNKTATTVKCENFQYNDSLFTRTAVTEFNLVCDRGFLDSVASSAYLLGFLVGGVLFGCISDRFGRKWTMVFCAYGMLIMMLAVTYVSSMELYILCRFLVAVFTMGCNIAIFSHLLELVGNNWRTFVGLSYRIATVVGYMLWSGIAYFYRDWRQMLLCALVLSSPFAVIVFLVPESPRWLFTRGQDEKGKKIVSLMARLNRVEITDSVWIESKNSSKAKNDENEPRSYSALDLFRFRGLRTLTLKVGFAWSVNSMLYYGILLNTGSLTGNILLNNIYAGILEIASYVVCILLLDRVGRRLMLTVTLTTAGVALLVTTVVDKYTDLITFVLVLAFVAKALVSISYAVIYNFTSELYPTVVRGSAVGVASMCARIGGITAPFMIGLQEYISWLPSTIFGVFAVIGGLLSLSLRDTTGRDMMETIEEAELFHAGKENTRSDELKEKDKGKENDAFEKGDEESNVVTIA